MNDWSLTSQEWAALALSVKTSLWSVAVMLAPGVACGWLLARKSFWGKTLVDALIHLPLVLPPVVVGYLLLVLLGRRGMIGRVLYESFGINIAFTWKAAALAAAVMGFPLLVRSVRLSIELVDVKLEQAARTLGASPLRVFATITLPLSIPGVLTGLMLAFARSLGEFGATITFAGNIQGQTQTLPIAIFTYTQVPGGDPTAMRLVMISVVLSLAALIASELLAKKTRQKLGQA